MNLYAFLCMIDRMLLDCMIELSVYDCVRVYILKYMQGCRYIPFYHVQDSGPDQPLTANVFTPQLISRALGLPHPQMLADMAMLLGNDSSKPLLSLYQIPKQLGLLKNSPRQKQQQQQRQRWHSTASAGRNSNSRNNNSSSSSSGGGREYISDLSTPTQVAQFLRREYDDLQLRCINNVRCRLVKYNKQKRKIARGKAQALALENSTTATAAVAFSSAAAAASAAAVEEESKLLCCTGVDCEQRVVEHLPLIYQLCYKHEEFCGVIKHCREEYNLRLPVNPITLSAVLAGVDSGVDGSVSAVTGAFESVTVSDDTVTATTTATTAATPSATTAPPTTATTTAATTAAATAATTAAATAATTIAPPTTATAAATETVAAGVVTGRERERIRSRLDQLLTRAVANAAAPILALEVLRTESYDTDLIPLFELPVMASITALFIFVFVCGTVCLFSGLVVCFRLCGA